MASISELPKMAQASVRTLSDAVDKLGAKLLTYAIALAAIGTIAMGILEMVKSVTRARMRFNQWQISKWTTPDAARSELLLLAVGAHSDPNALYDQPVEKMMGQIQAAVNLALEYPDQYPHLYGFITEVPATYVVGGEPHGTSQDGTLWKMGAAGVHRLRTQLRTIPPTENEMADAQKASAARARLNNLVARKLDAFQNQTQYLWERLNQLAATGIAVVIFLIAIGISSKAPSGPEGWLLAFALSLPAGVVAPFAKQLASSLTSFGK